MTGKELKAFAATVPDDSIIEVLPLGMFHSWDKIGSIRASLVQSFSTAAQQNLTEAREVKS